jgi:hypothetical protein
MVSTEHKVLLHITWCVHNFDKRQCYFHITWCVHNFDKRQSVTSDYVVCS